MANILTALKRVKDDLATWLEPQAIVQACQEAGHRWRAGPLDPVNTVGLFIQQIAQGNLSCAAVRHHAEQPFTASAFCQARQRLPLEVWHTLSRRVGRQAAALAGAEGQTPEGHWHGHRVWVVDGTHFSMPDTPQLQQHFGQSKVQQKGCGFPVAHLLCLFDHHTGLLAEPTPAPLYTSDLQHVDHMHAQMGAGDVVLGDDYFGNWGHFALVLRQEMHLLTPNHHRRIVSFKARRRHAQPKGGRDPIKGLPRSRWIKRLGPHDQLVEWFKPVERPAWMSPELWDTLPESLIVREVRRVVRRQGFRPMTVTIVTTLLDPVKYPADELTHLRLRRWEVETDLRHLKTTLGLEVLKCQTVPGVLKELAVFVLVYNLVRLVMLEAARRQGVPPERISFADTLAWLRAAGPDDPLPDLVVNPLRPGRVEPRAVKRRPKPYALLNRPRQELRKALQHQKMAA